MDTNTEKPDLVIGSESADGSVVIVDPSEQPAPGAVPAGQLPGGEAHAGSYEGSTGGADDDHDDDEAAAAAAADAADANSTDPEIVARRERRRQERRDRKIAQREREDAYRSQLIMLQNQNAELSARLVAVERRTGDSEIAQLDNALQRGAQALTYYKNIIAEATQKQDGQTVANATEKMLQVQGEINRLQNIRQTYARAVAQPAAGGTPDVDPLIKQHAGAWMARNQWYNPAGTDADSRVALALDQALAAEGKDPRTPEYYAELDRRMRRYMPHRFTPSQERDYNGGANSREKPGGSPVTGGGRNERGTGGSGSAGAQGSTFTLSPDRVRALKDAGMWDDVKQRNEAIRRYRDHDRAVAAAAAQNR